MQLVTQHDGHEILEAKEAGGLDGIMAEGRGSSDIVYGKDVIVLDRLGLGRGVEAGESWLDGFG